MIDPELAAWVKQARQGNREAFDHIVRLTARMVYAQIVAAVRDRQRAEDLTQETFIAAWKALPTLTQPEGFISWLLTIARNTMLDAQKFDHRQKRSAPTAPAAGEEAAGAPDASPSPSEEAQSHEARDRALLMLEELPEDYRKPLTLRYLAGADYQTIQRQLGLSDGALRGLLNRGMALLRERMTSETQHQRSDHPRRDR